VPDDRKSAIVSRTIHAPAERIFDYLARPSNHYSLDTSGMIRESEDRSRIDGTGTTFLINMSNDFKGDHQIENHVVIYEPDRAIGWAPADPGQAPAGHTWVWRLVPDGDDTVVSQTYDWSRFTDVEGLDHLPLIDRRQMEHSLELLARATESIR